MIRLAGGLTGGQVQRWEQAAASRDCGCCMNEFPSGDAHRLISMLQGEPVVELQQ